MAIICLTLLLFTACSSNKGNDLIQETTNLVIGINLDASSSPSIQAIREEFEVSEISVTLKDGSDPIKEVINIEDGATEASVQFNDIKKGTYDIEVIAKDKDGYRVYQGIERRNISGDDNLVVIRPSVVQSEGLVIDFRNIDISTVEGSLEEGEAKVFLIPSIDGIEEEIQLDLARTSLESVQANKYTLEIDFNGRTLISIENIDVMPGRVTYATIDLATEELEIKYQRPGPAISVSPEIERYISELDVNLYVDDSAVVRRYTIDGTDPQENGIDFAYGDEVSFANVSVGETRILNVYAEDEAGNSSRREYRFTNAYEEENPNGTSLKLGGLYTKDYSIFRIWSPDSNDVTVEVNGKEYKLERINNFAGYTDIYDVKVEGVPHLAEYSFRVNGTPVRDPYGVMVVPGTNTNILMDPSTIQPEGGWFAEGNRSNLSSTGYDAGFEDRTDAIIYEIHVRDFTWDENSGVPEDKRGKFMGMVEEGTKTDKGSSTGIDHLIDLGITHVHIMPFYDFTTEMYNWGYDPENYNVPEDQYSMTPKDYENRVREVKEMVDRFHRNGLRVIMDVTYNHTYNMEMFQHITDKYYTDMDLSGTGNSIDTGVPMVSRMIQDSLEYWATEYNLDGFRFDLMGIFQYEEVDKWAENLQEKVGDRTILLYGEPWNGYAPSYPGMEEKLRLGNINLLADNHVGVFSPQFRDAIRGSGDHVGTDGTKGYMFNHRDPEAIRIGVRGSILHESNLGAGRLDDDWDSMYAARPEQSINYVSKHDNLALWDKIRLEFEGTDDYFTWEEDKDYAKQINKFAMGIVMTSQGIPFMHGGDEFLRTKIDDSNFPDVDHVVDQARNTYNQPEGRRTKKDVNTIRWEWKDQNSDIFEYYRDLIQLRKDNPGYRMNSWYDVNDHMEVEIDDRVVISIIDGSVNGGYDLITIYNPHQDEDYEYDFPAGEWREIFNSNGSVDNQVSEKTTAERTAITVFRRH